MELLAVGLLGAVLFLGPEDIDKYLKTGESQKEELVVETNQEPSNQPSNTKQLNSLSKQYDPLNSDAIYVEPEIDSVLIDPEQAEAETSTVDKATRKFEEIAKPVAEWYDKIKQANKARADRHTFIRNRTLLD